MLSAKPTIAMLEINSSISRCMRESRLLKDGFFPVAALRISAGASPAGPRALQGLAGADKFGIHSRQMQPAAIAAMLHFKAFVHDRQNARFPGLCRGIKANDAQLRPHGFGLDRNHLLDNCRALA